MRDFIQPDNMYLYPKFTGIDCFYFRILGDGLGNLLFPWARAVSLSSKYNLPIIAPTWPQLKIGPLMRNEPDKRFYSDLFSHTDRYVSGIRKVKLLTTLPKLTEDIFLNACEPAGSRNIVYIGGMDGFFSSIINDHELIKRELLAITNPKHKLQRNISEHAISVHVRLGDFQKTSASNVAALTSGAFNTQLPISWYKQMIIRLRNILGYDYPVIIWSDDAGDKLEELVNMPNTRREFLGSSIADMLGMSSARVLVASGSSFSMWASYLGRMPVIWYPGQLRQKLYSDKSGAEIEVSETDDLSLLETFRNVLLDSGKV